MVKDHLGNEFEKVEDMCDYHDVATMTFYRKLKTGMSVKEILTTCKKKSVYDHRGNKFTSQNKMCEKYGVSKDTFIRRKKKGYTLQECLEGRKEITVYDHEGNGFESEAEMSRHWDVSFDLYMTRKAKGWSMKDRLTKPVKTIKMSCSDCFGNNFESLTEKCEHYGVNIATYKTRTEEFGWSDEEALNIIPRFKSGLKFFKVDDELEILRVISDNTSQIYFYCIFRSEESIMTHDEIIEYYKKHVLKVV